MTVLVNYDAVPPLVSGSQPLAGRWPSDPTTQNARLASRLQRAYIERVQEYQREFERAERINSVEGTGPLESGYPSVALLLDGVRSEFPVDETLYRSLFDLYTFYGWNGVGWAQSALLLLHNERPGDATSAVTWRFFMYTRNLLGVLIRETLIELEERAAKLVFERLGAVNRRLSAALMGELAFTYKPGTTEAGLDVMETVQNVPDQYVMKNKAIATALYELLTKAVERRDKYDQLVGKQSKLRQLQKDASGATVKEGAPGWRSPSAGEDRAADRMKLIDAQLHQTAGPVETALADFQAAQKDVFAKSPFALIAVSGLAPGFSKERMEDALGRMLTQVAEGVDEIASATRPGESRVARHMPGLPSDWQNDTTGSKKLEPRTVERLYSPGLSLEFHLAEAAARDANSDAAISWLLEPRSWQMVMAAGTVEPGSFEHIVLFNWSHGLNTFQSETAKDRFGLSHKLGVAASALSLITLVFPPLAILNAIAAVALLADAAHSAAQRLADVDHAIAAQLPALGEPGEVALAELGGLLAMRPRVAAEIAGELVVLLATLGAAQRIRAVRVALEWKGYVDDVSTVVHASDQV